MSTSSQNSSVVPTTRQEKVTQLSGKLQSMRFMVRTAGKEESAKQERIQQLQVAASKWTNKASSPSSSMSRGTTTSTSTSSFSSSSVPSTINITSSSSSSSVAPKSIPAANASKLSLSVNDNNTSTSNHNNNTTTVIRALRTNTQQPKTKKMFLVCTADDETTVPEALDSFAFSGIAKAPISSSSSFTTSSSSTTIHSVPNTTSTTAVIAAGRRSFGGANVSLEAMARTNALGIYAPSAIDGLDIDETALLNSAFGRGGNKNNKNKKRIREDEEEEDDDDGEKKKGGGGGARYQQQQPQPQAKLKGSNARFAKFSKIKEGKGDRR